MTTELQNQSRPKLRVLLVEDDATVADRLLEELRSRAVPNLHIDTSDTVSCAMELLKQRAVEGDTYDIALLDLSLSEEISSAPELNAEIFKQLRLTMPASIVVLTSAFPTDPEVTKRVLKEMRSPAGPRSLFIPRDESFWERDVCDVVVQVQQMKREPLRERQQSAQSTSCFISYSHKDEMFVKRLFNSLKEARIEVWYAPAHMKPGLKIQEEVEKNIRLYDKLLLIISENSMGSAWVATEIRAAFQEERRTGKRKLLRLV